MISAEQNACRPSTRPTVPESITVTEVGHKTIEPRAWDEFAKQCATSFQCTYAYLRAWAFKNSFRYDLRLFELHVQESGAPQKVGQCAIGVGAAGSVFVGELQLLGGHSRSWTGAMTALLNHLGPGRYRYGSTDSLEKRREEDLGQIGAVRIESVRPVVVEAVDFSRWPTWEDYWHAISSNSRRNARRAEALIPDLSIAVCQGFKAALHLPVLLSLRTAMYKRKGLAFQPWRDGLSDLGMILGCPQYACTAVVWARNRPLAAISAIEFGSHVYYANGGSRPDNGGAAWYLTIALLRRAYERDPKTAKFIMGYVDYATHDEQIGGGLLRFRRSCRVSAYPTSIVCFSYDLQERSSGWPARGLVVRREGE
jgi:hypothetical protein